MEPIFVSAVLICASIFYASEKFEQKKQEKNITDIERAANACESDMVSLFKKGSLYFECKKSDEIY